MWGPDGKTLYYRAGGKMIAADIVTSPAFTVTSREALFTDHFLGTRSTASYDVSRDGKTFLMIGSSSESAQRIVVVTGWLDELKDRCCRTRGSGHWWDSCRCTRRAEPASRPPLRRHPNRVATQ